MYCQLVHSFMMFLNYVFNPKRILNFVVFVACLSISIFQLIGCIRKLRNPPVSTHYRFILNDTLNYPAITICRNPAYDVQKLKKFNLDGSDGDMSVTSEWMKFPFHNTTLQQVWEQATYPQTNTILLYGLHGFAENVEVRSSYHLMHGQCYTLIPLLGATAPWPKSGWSVLLSHDDVAIPPDSSGMQDFTPGYHIYVHEPREPWLENELQAFSIIEYTFLEVGEELKIKISPEEYNQVSTSQKTCINDVNYSASKCAETKRWINISESVGCTGPWMPGIMMPQCDNYKSLNRLINKYMEFDSSHSRGCYQSCNSTAYKMFVVNRVPMDRPLSHFYLYYSSKMVSVLQETLAYDWNAFLADLGGSLGFFLGISVVGTIGLLQKCVRLMVCLRRVENDVECTEKN